jgi:hypothetical protein
MSLAKRGEDVPTPTYRITACDHSTTPERARIRVDIGSVRKDATAAEKTVSITHGHADYTPSQP